MKVGATSPDIQQPVAAVSQFNFGKYFSARSTGPDEAMVAHLKARQRAGGQCDRPMYFGITILGISTAMTLISSCSGSNFGEISTQNTIRFNPAQTLLQYKRSYGSQTTMYIYFGTKCVTPAPAHTNVHIYMPRMHVPRPERPRAYPHVQPEYMYSRPMHIFMLQIFIISYSQFTFHAHIAHTQLTLVVAIDIVKFA
eukprot:1354890-Amorphochlora_amoeboformis.AAC.3